jgi:hypothetical protein
MKNFGTQIYYSLDILKPYQRRILSGTLLLAGAFIPVVFLGNITYHGHIVNSASEPCRNCGATEFYTGDIARTIPIMLSSPPPKFRLRVCGVCGLVDWFLPANTVEKLKKKFPREETR